MEANFPIGVFLRRVHSGLFLSSVASCLYRLLLSRLASSYQQLSVAVKHILYGYSVHKYKSTEYQTRYILGIGTPLSTDADLFLAFPIWKTPPRLHCPAEFSSALSTFSTMSGVLTMSHYNLPGFASPRRSSQRSGTE